MRMLKNLAMSLRLNQWYKNFLVFLGIIFEKKIFEVNALGNIILVFVLFCMISSSNYVINDILDKKQDALNQIKSRSVFTAMPTSRAVLCSIGLVGTCVFLSICFIPDALLFLLLFSAFGQFYNIYAKRVPIIDTAVLSAVYFIRIYVGYYVLDVFPYALIVLPVVLLALFLIFIKKRSTLLILGEKKAMEFRQSYSFYTLHRNDIMIKVLGIGLALLYLLYVVINEKFNKIILILTVPEVCFLIYTVATSTKKQPEFGIFLWKTLGKVAVIAPSAAIITLYMVDFLLF